MTPEHCLQEIDSVNYDVSREGFKRTENKEDRKQEWSEILGSCGMCLEERDLLNCDEV